MAITRAQQARQMLKTAGAVEQDGSLNFVNNSESVTVPKEFKARSNAPKVKLAYITDAEAKMLKKKKPGTPHKGPKGIPSYDTFGSIDSSGKDTGVSGETASGFERGDRGERSRADARAAGFSPQDVQDFRSAAIAAGAGQRVNPGFFDSRNLVSPADLAAARAIAPKAFARSRGSGIMNFIRGGGLFGNLIRGLGQRFGFGKKFNEPSFDMSRFANLPLGGSASFQNLDIRDKYNRLDTDDEDENINLNDYQGLTNLDFINRISESDMSLTPEQKELIKENSQEQDFNNFDDAMFASGLTTPSEGKFGLNLVNYSRLKNNRYSDKQIQEAVKGGYVNDLLGTLALADGGMIGGGIMDAAGRQQYFLGKLVKKAKRAVKKIVKSPLGKLGIGAALAFTPFGKAAIGKFAGLSDPMKYLIGGAGLSALPFIFGNQEDDTQQLASMGSVGGQIDPRAYTNPRDVLFPAFRMAEGGRIGLKDGEGIMKVASGPDMTDTLNELANELFGKDLTLLTEEEMDILNSEAQRLMQKFMADGGSAKEPVAKKTMPLLDMGGQEMDLRAEGGFVPIGRMEKADDVPARLSKNEFVFTADAVRNAGDGDVDKGAEVMYNMMKNLEAGGDVSQESQGLEGAREMFQTSKRLEEIL